MTGFGQLEWTPEGPVFHMPGAPPKPPAPAPENGNGADPGRLPLTLMVAGGGMAVVGLLFGKTGLALAGGVTAGVGAASYPWGAEIWKRIGIGYTGPARDYGC